MPSLLTHLKICEKINQSLQLTQNEFYLGSILPDLIENHKSSHFSNYRIPNIDNYLKIINSKLSVVEIGYLCHLLADKFYNEFMFKNYINKRDNDLISIKINENEEYYSEDKINQLKHSVYENYDIFIVKNLFLNPFNDLEFLNDLKMPRLTNLVFDKEYIKNRIKEINYKTKIYKDKNIKYVFSSQSELDNLFLDCCNYILRYIENNNI